LSLPVSMRKECDYELFASPFNAVVPNGRYASKFPHIECRFGSIGSYPEVLKWIPRNSFLSVSPPFTRSYMDDLAGRLSSLLACFRLQLRLSLGHTRDRALLRMLPGGQSSLVQDSYDASSQCFRGAVHPAHPIVLWKDTRERCNSLHCDLGDTTALDQEDRIGGSSLGAGMPLPPGLLPCS